MKRVPQQVYILERGDRRIVVTSVTSQDPETLLVSIMRTPANSVFLRDEAITLYCLSDEWELKTSELSSDEYIWMAAGRSESLDVGSLSTQDCILLKDLHFFEGDGLGSIVSRYGGFQNV